MSESTPSPAEQPAPQSAPAVETRQVSLPVPLQSGERILLRQQRHWMYLWPNIVLNLLLGIIPTIAFIWLVGAVGIEGTAANIIIAVYLVFFLIRIIMKWYQYHNDYWAITNQRVIDVRRKHPFNMEVSTADLVNIQDMTISRNGLLKTMLDYGDVVCQTAGTSADFMIGGVPDPRAIQALVDRERDRERMRVRGSL